MYTIYRNPKIVHQNQILWKTGRPADEIPHASKKAKTGAVLTVTENMDVDSRNKRVRFS
jgi:hypothetical protein